MVKIKNKKIQFGEVDHFKGILIQYKNKTGLDEEVVFFNELEKFRIKHNLSQDEKIIAKAMIDYFNLTLKKGESKRNLIRTFNIYETFKYIRND